MKVGDLVKHRKDFGYSRLGIVWSIGSSAIGVNPIVQIVWQDGKLGATHIKFLEVISESR